ncbi:telomerase protein component 1 [Stegostoma tigrinum]|uniref:telomerase protein component 1 n=1 Tax=Stegostoma tigrinum TaxID=3053191 RepID=UPI002870AF63|nr:telomerase protein component 1 [Stegostoma tigrinum]
MKTDGSRLTRPRTGLGSGPPRVGTATLRPAGFQVPRTSAQHHLTPRIRLPAAWLENKFLVPPPGARAGLPKPTLRFSQPLDPRLPLGLGAWRGGPHSLAHKPDPRQLEPGCQPESRAEGTIDSREQAWEVPAELPELLPAYDLSNEDYEDLVQARVDLADEELQDVADPSQNRDAVLRRKKVQLLNEVCCSLIKGGNLAEKEDETRERLQVLCEEIAQQDPEFLLKVALYTRQELNIRSTANFLLALSAWLLPSRPHLRRYFCQAVRLPSDWIEVARLYQSLASNTGSLAPYPSCLRQSLSDRFKGFDEYQLAKYNSRKQRCKNCSKRLQRSSLTANETNPKTPFSLKKLVRWLHLKEPAYHVMCLLGRRYPADLQSFSRSRLPGPWDSRRAGKRMKFELPESWERQLSLHGNTAAVWEQLIDHQKLPFMAMLRNLRNMIAAGISTPHHSQLLRRLTDKDSVIRSRQFPFRFLAAYQALNELQRRLDEKDEPLPTKAALVQKALESLRLPRRRMQFLARSRAAPLQFRGKRIEFVHQWATKKLEDLRKSRIVRYDREILERYRRALAAAVEISASHNMSPLPGRTAVLCSVSHNMTQPCVSAKGLYVPRTRTKEEEDQAQIRRSPMILDVAILLALMAHHVSEHAQLILFNNDTYREIQLESGTVLSNVDRVLQEAKSLQESESASFDGPSGTVAFMMDCIQNHTPIDTIFQLDCFYNYNIKEAVQLYRYHVNPDTLFVLVQMSAFHCSIEDEADSKDVILGGYSEQILRFLCERGSARLLEHVEGIDEVFQLPRARGDRGRKRRKLVEPMASNPLLQTPTLRWRTVRVFVSSTFRDMCSERDLLIRSVFPELRARAARHFVRVEEVDLRWGITEEESRSNRQLELCLTEVSRCQLFVGILGERYGQILSEYPLPDLPQFEWVKSYPRNRSITELEIMQFLRLHDNSPSEHAFFYTRDPAVLRSLPETWMSDFASESEEARTRVTHLKGHVKEAGLLVLENYRSELGADVSGRPFLKGLEEFGTSVLDRLWKAIVSQYCQADCSPAPDEDAFQGAFREAQARQHHGRLRQLEGTALSIRDRRAGGLLVVHGKHGQGKTAFMASLITLLSGGSVEHSPGRSHLLFHFTGATETATDAAGTLHRLCRLLTAQLKDRHEPLPQSYRGLVLEFHSLLENFAHRHPRGHLILLVDGADCIQTRNNQRTSDWIPETVPHRVTLVLSVTEDSPLHQALATRKGLVPVHLGPLEPLDRSEIVRRYLAIFGKKLEESAFNNQMRQLVMKKESHNPLFLKLASDDLREFGVFEKVSDQIRALPPTLRGLIQHALGCLEREQGQDVVTVALGALYVSTKGLRERDLYCVLCTSRGLPTGSASPSWEEVMEEAEKPRRPVPMASFARLMRSLRSILGIWTPPAEMPTSRLRLSGALLRAAVCQRYLRDARHERQLHQLLAVHLWRLIDPKGNGLFAKCDPEALSDLPQHLILCGQLSRLASLLTNLHFCHLHLQLKLLAQLNVTFNLYRESLNPPLMTLRNPSLPTVTA